MNVYDVIKSLCDERGLAVTALEKELGFGRGSIGKLKKGGSTTAVRLRRIGDYFGVSTEYLFPYELFLRKPHKCEKIPCLCGFFMFWTCSKHKEF